MTLLSGRYRWLIGIISLPFILFLAVWLLSPFAARSIANKALENYGLSVSDDTQIRLNLFKGQVTVDTLGLIKNAQTQASLEHLSINIALLKLINSHLHIEAFAMNGLHLPIEQNNDTTIVAGVDTKSLQASTQEAPDTTTNNDEKPAEFLITAPSIVIEQLHIPLVLNGHPLSASVQQLNLTELHASQNRQSVKTVIVATLDEAKLNISADASVTADGLQATLTANVDNFNLATTKVIDNPVLATVNGTLGVDIEAAITGNKTFDAFSVNIPTASIGLNNFSANPQANLFTKLDKLTLSLSNKTELSLADTENLVTEGNIAISAAQFIAKDGNDLLAAVDKLDIPTLDYSAKGKNIDAIIKAISIAGITASQTPGNKALLSSEQLDVTGITANTQKLAIESVTLGASEANLTLTETGLPKELVAIARTNATEQPSNTSSASAAETTTNPFHVSLQQLQLTAPFNVHIKDETAKPVFAQQWNIDALKVQNFNTETPELPTTASLVLSDSGYAKIKAELDATVLQPLPTGHLNAQLKELDLYPYSPYIESTLGIVIRAGQLDQNIKVALEKGKINGDTDLHLRGLKLASNTPLTTDALASGTALGLNQALGMLQDKKGNIDLDVPLSGDTQSPEFGIQGFTKLVIKKAAINQAKSYLVDTFVPYAKVVKLAVAGGSYLLKLRFEPLILQSGIEDFDDEQQQFISQLAQLMNDNPKQRLQACPIANSPDTLTQVGKQANTLKRLLVDTHGIESARVLLCTAKTNNKNDAENRIEFSFK